MIQTSIEYNEKIKNGRTFYTGATITPVVGTPIVIDDTDDRIMAGGMTFDDAITQDGELNIGQCIPQQFNMILDNSDHVYDTIDFIGAVVEPWIELQLSASIEHLEKGVFNVIESKKVGKVVTLTCLDNMIKFDVPFIDVPITYPTTAPYRTAGEIIDAICTFCGVARSTGYGYSRESFEIRYAPSDDLLASITCREMLGYLAQINGSYGSIDTAGELYFSWFEFNAVEQILQLVDGGDFSGTTSPYETGDVLDGGTFDGTSTPYADGAVYDAGDFTDTMGTGSFYHNFFDMISADIKTYDITISKVIVRDTNLNYKPKSYGDFDYFTIVIENNPLIQTEADAIFIADEVGIKLVGGDPLYPEHYLRPMELTMPSNPSVEAGDIAMVNDDIGNTYVCAITRLNFTINSPMMIVCETETNDENMALSSTPSTKAITDAWVKSGNITGVNIYQVKPDDTDIVMTEFTTDTQGARMLMYDINGLLNVKMGVEAGISSNTGGTFILYEDRDTTLYPLSDPDINVIRAKQRIVFANLQDYHAGYGYMQDEADQATIYFTGADQGVGGVPKGVYVLGDRVVDSVTDRYFLTRIQEDGIRVNDGDIFVGTWDNGVSGSVFTNIDPVNGTAMYGADNDLYIDEADLVLDTGRFRIISNTADASASSTDHAFQVGDDPSTNIIMDTNEIMARNNGSVSSLHLNADGGNVTVNNNVGGAGSGVVYGGDSGWIDIRTAGMSNGFKDYSTSQYPRYRRVGMMVQLSGAMSPAVGGSIGNATGLTAFTLPSGFRPTVGDVRILCQGTGTSQWLLNVQDTGVVTVSRYQQGGTYDTTITGDEWLPFNVTFFV